MKQYLIKRWVRVLLPIVLVGFIQTRNIAQIEITKTPTINTEFISADIDEATKMELIKVIQKKINIYASVADFVKMNGGGISPDKSIAFGELFTSGAEVINDLVKKPEMIHNADYSDNVFEYLSSTGVKFDLDNIILDQLGINASGNYFAAIEMDKIMFTSLDDQNNGRYNSKGKRVNMKMQFEIPAYDFGLAKITRISGEINEVRLKYSVLSAWLRGGYGLVNNKVGVNTGFEEATINQFNYGFGVLYRFSLNNKRKLFIAGGFGIDYHTVNASYNFNGSGDEIGHLLGVSEPVDQSFINNNEKQNVVITSKFIPNSSDEGKEQINGFRASVPIGISYKLVNNINTNMYLDLLLVPAFTFGFNTGSRELNLEGIKRPIEDTSYFPSEEELLNNEVELAAYQTETQLTQTVNKASSNFSYGIMLSPVYQYDLNTNFGLEFGADVFLGLSSLFQEDQIGNSEAFGARTDEQITILQDYYTSTVPWYINLKAGVYYEFGKGR